MDAGSGGDMVPGRVSLSAAASDGVVVVDKGDGKAIGVAAAAAGDVIGRVAHVSGG